jgi:predicted TIM-barrel fold metal-dependent hydrolase
MILAHFGSWKMWDETEKELLGLPIYLETSFTLSFLDENRFIKMVRKHGAEKILFGTDAPWGSQKDELMKINAVALSDAEKEMITRKNAALLLGNPL